uniref:Uncharacterized protein n=1 Tax=Rhizophora mucronata TaxID=61149 RepID=A0A2P2NUB7_RHIMU
MWEQKDKKKKMPK